MNAVTKRYGVTEAVQNVSFETGAGEIVGLLGPNGARKTTVMNMIAGLVRPTAGAPLFPHLPRSKHTAAQ